MTVPIISASVAAIVIILQQVLMLRVSMYRGKVNVGVGTNNDATLERKMRRHGNLAENAALYVATLTLAELCGVPKAVVAVFGTVFIVSRLIHVASFASLAGSHFAKGGKVFFLMRVIGAVGSLLTGVGLGFFLIFATLSERL